MNRNRWRQVLLCVFAVGIVFPPAGITADNPATQSVSNLTTPGTSWATESNKAPAWLTEPLSLADCINLAMTQNSAILKSKRDVEAAHGVVLQTRAIVIPKVQAGGKYQIVDGSSIDKFPFLSSLPTVGGVPVISYPDQSWNASVQLVQSIYEGGRMSSAVRSARLIREQAILGHQAVISDTLFAVKSAFADVLLAEDQIKVQRASIKLLTNELEDNERRFNAGTVPRFNYLRAAVQLTNAMPKLIRAENSLRIAKNNLVNQLGYDVPQGVSENIPLQLTGRLEYEPYDIRLSDAISQALTKRPELEVTRKAKMLRKEGITSAKAGYKPSVQSFVGFGSRNSSFTSDLSKDVSGWFAGAQMSWNIFDGMMTKGKIDEAKALHEKAVVDVDDVSRKIELEVRTSYSSFIEAKQVLEAQQEVEKLADEALRLAKARSEAGTGTQLDVLSAETSLTEARTTHSVALHDYFVARARLERAVGHTVITQSGAK